VGIAALAMAGLGIRVAGRVRMGTAIRAVDGDHLRVVAA